MEYLLIALVVFAIVVVAKGLRVLRPFERGVVERLGKFHRIAHPGVNLIWPFFESLRRVDMRERVIDVPPQEVITKDNVVVTVDAVIYFEVTDPAKVLYNVEQFEYATLKLAQTNLRNLIGDMELDDTLTSRERINTQLRQVLDDATDKWGVRITRVEIQKIDPPRDITEAMSRQMKAERERRAMVTEAEGVKEAAIRRAEGEKEALIREAEGRAEATRKVAEAERFKVIALAEAQAEAIRRVYGAIHEGRPTQEVLAVKYLEALEKIAEGKANKVFLPLDTSGLLGAVASMGEVFREATRIPRELELEEVEAAPEPSVTKQRMEAEAAAEATQTRSTRPS